jgi:hypothetical protein
MAQDGSAAFSFGCFLPLVQDKLTRGNYGMWHAQVTATLMGAHLIGFIKPTAHPLAEFLEADAVAVVDGQKAHPVPNPDYEKWIAKDSYVRSYLFSISKEIFTEVSSSTTSAKLWAAIQDLQASQSRA